MSKLSEAFKKRQALIAYITAGDPDLAATEKLVLALEKAGADIVELGIPFSDPLADGPVIQASHQRALKKNTGLTAVFKTVKHLRRKTSIPICFMLAYNLILQYGPEKFFSDCEKFGIDGVIIPDLPPEEFKGRQEWVDLIFLVAPTSTDERIKLAAEKSTGFVYLVSVAGITGARKNLAENLADLVGRIRQHTLLPVAIGFGISTPAQARAAAAAADGVIVGSAIVDLIAKKKFSAVGKFVAGLRKAIDA
ncbi:tryptophan synthase subunit alpha [Candidatus Saganbacteria bacterium]|nr:tryptophan synthase subunit alpha [Candidatus Saganbacteria bacterium]